MWHRIVVLESILLARLHHVIQCIMGWNGGHLHEFEIAGERYGTPTRSLTEAIRPVSSSASSSRRRWVA
nr:hypothetical protein [Zoogloea sp.]